MKSDSYHIIGVEQDTGREIALYESTPLPRPGTWGELLDYLQENYKSLEAMDPRDMYVVPPNEWGVLYVKFIINCNTLLILQPAVTKYSPKGDES